MALILSIVKHPPESSPQRREILQGVTSIGRGVECDWILPDPSRVLSKRHCLFSPNGASWTVTDVSRNGTRLAGKMLDPGIPYPLTSGDLIAMGSYELEADIETGMTTAVFRHSGRDGLIPQAPATFDQGSTLQLDFSHPTLSGQPHASDIFIRTQPAVPSDMARALQTALIDLRSRILAEEPIHSEPTHKEWELLHFGPDPNDPLAALDKLSQETGTSLTFIVEKAIRLLRQKERSHQLATYRKPRIWDRFRMLYSRSQPATVIPFPVPKIEDRE